LAGRKGVSAERRKDPVSQNRKQIEAIETLVRHMETGLAAALTSMTGKEFTVTVRRGSESGPDETEGESVVWAQAFSFGPGPSLWLAAGRDLWSEVGRLTLSAVGIDTLTDDDCKATWHEILGQTMGSVASAITVDIHREINATKGDEIDSPPENLDWTILHAVCEGEPGWNVNVAWSPDLIALYDPPSALEVAQLSGETPFSKTFDLLLDVALPVSVSFGKTLLQIREVLKLNTGSIVELNRFVNDPVEVVVNDCVIARGEVVVVDGNYGVRVTHLASREDRLRSGMLEPSVKAPALIR
jgi:flagellar motor switch protein FliN/FliY